MNTSRVSNVDRVTRHEFFSNSDINVCNTVYWTVQLMHQRLLATIQKSHWKCK